MASEHATVTIASDQGTWVEAAPSAACEGCASRGSCQAVGAEKNSVQVLNPLEARTGDTVVITFKTGSLLKALFLIYMVPVLALLVGACLGNWVLAPLFNRDPSVVSAAAGFLSFFAAIGFAKKRAGRMEKSDAYRPRITRIVKRGPNVPAPTASDSER